MGDWPLGQISRTSIYGGDTGDSYGLDYTTHSTANTKGAWVELCSAAPDNVIGVDFVFLHGGQSDYLCDLGIGAEGSEMVLIGNMPRQNVSANSYRLAVTYSFPIGISVGQRVAVRAQSTTGSKGINVAAIFRIGSFISDSPFGRVITFGANEADSGGTPIDPGSDANTKGSYVALEDSTEAPLNGLLLAMAGSSNISRTECGWLVDVAIGAEGSEQAIIENYCINVHSVNNVVAPQASPFFPIVIPIGSRIAVRAQCSITDATDRLFDVILFGVS